jgi:hypothetical protein
MKRIFTLLFAAMLAGQAWAQTTFEVGNLKYTVTDKTNHYVSVGKAGTKPTGDLEIKDTVSYEGVIYTVTSIPSSGFYGCNKLTSITLPSTITSIGFESFYNCNQLTAFTIPSAVTSIGKYAFRACSSLTSINIPSGVSSIGENAFESCSGLTAFNVESDNAMYCSIDGVLFKKKNTYLTLMYYPTSKADTEYNLPDNVSSIENKAFYGCKFLASINVSNSNKDFYSDNGVLLDINKRTLIVYPSQKADTAYSIPNTVVIILYKAFYQCQNIKSLIIPKSVTDIDEYSIHNCTNLTVKCCAASKPEGWLEKWSYNVADVVWGYTPEETPGTKTWTVSLSANNSSYGSVSGGGTIVDGKTTTITATPAEGYEFVKWSNGLTTSTATITVTSNLTLVAEFAEKSHAKTWNVTVSANNASYGTVSGGGKVADGSTTTITASPASGYKFVKWSNGLTTASATINVTSDTTLVAEFAPKEPLVASELHYEITSDSTVEVVRSDDYLDKTTIVIPETVEIDGETYTVTRIGTDAFRDCKKLTSLNLSKTVTEIDLNALWDCSGLTEINVDGANTTLSSVDGVVFNKDKTELIRCPLGKTGSYTIPSSVTDIHYGAFLYCHNLMAIDIPNSVKHIDGAAFMNCVGLTEIAIPEGITEIASQIFDGCTSLTSVTIPESVTEIGGNAFEYCSSLTSITIPQDVTSISLSAFRGCDNLTEMNLNGHSNYSFENQTLFNKDKTELLCCLNSKVTEYTIPNTVKKIGDYAFTDCDLESITIPNSVTTIGYDAFYRCWYLTSITLPESLTEIGGYAFAHCGNLKTVIMPESVVKIEESAFYRCDSLAFNEYENTLYLGTNDNPYFALIKAKSTDITSCKINSQCKIIAKDAFYDCDNLQYNEYDNAMYLGSSENQYYMLVKAKSTDIKSCEINSGCRLIWNSAFSNCSKLTSVIVPDGVVQIGDYAFFYCDSLTSINIPDGVTKIGESAFYNCESLTSITIPDGITSIGEYTFNNCESLTSVTIPESVSEIGYSAFFGCSKLTSINIPSGVTSIGNWAIGRCGSLTTINIPKTVTTIGEGAFSSCYNLNIFCEAESKPDGWNDKWNRDNLPVVWGIDVSKKMLKVTLSTKYDWCGIVAGGGWAADSSTVTITATPAEDYKFVKWSNGLTNATANITVTSDTALVAEFEYVQPILYSVNLSASNSEYGRVSGGGYVKYGKTITIAATPAEGCKFVKWSNGLTTDTATITVTSDTTIVAEFAEILYAGYCGTDARWRYNMLSQTITISGTGSIDKYKTVGSIFTTLTSNTPWSEIANNIKHVVVDEGITDMGSRAFWGCENLETVKLPSTCTSYGGLTFAECPKLKEVVVAATTVWQVDEYCFSNYDSCTLYVPTGYVDYYKKNTVFGLFSKIVGAYMVTVNADIKNGTVEVESYTIPEGGKATVTPKPDEGYSVIDVNFEGNYGSRIIYNGYIYAVDDVRSNIYVSVEFGRESESSFTYRIIDGTNVEITAYNGTDSVIAIPSTITDNGVEYTVTSIGDRAFDGNSDIKSVTIPNTVTNIGESAFSYPDLTSLTVPNSVKTIGEHAFSDVKNVVYNGSASGSPWGALTINGTVDGNYVFADAEKTHLTAYINPTNNMESSIDIPETVVSIGLNAILNVWAKQYGDAYYWGNEENPYLILWKVGSLTGDDDNDITSFEVHEGCKYIYASAFASLNELESVTISNSVVSINQWAFVGCNNLTSVTIPGSVKYIGEGAFWGCEKLRSVIISDGVETIGNDAFGKCVQLSSVSIAGSVKTIGDRAFTDCPNLSSLTISDGVEKIGEGAFCNCHHLESLNIPKSVTEIGERAFDDCYLLTIYSDATEWPAGWLFSESEVSEVIFKTTAVAETAANAVNIYAHGNTIVVENATDEIRVYDAMGRLIVETPHCDVSTEIRVNTAGVYIVKVGNAAKRVVVNDK